MRHRSEMEHIKETITKIAGKKITSDRIGPHKAGMCGKQELAFNGRPFVLCGLPLPAPPENANLFMNAGMVNCFSRWWPIRGTGSRSGRIG